MLQGENSQLLISGLLSQSGRLNSYLNLENLDLSRWLDNEISTNLTGLAILDGGLTSNGSLEQIDLTLEVLETKYFEVGETSFHGQVSYKDSIISTASPAMLLIGNSQLTLDGSLDFSTENLDIIADLENADIQLVNQFWPGNFNSGKATGRMQISGPYTTPSATAELLCNNIVYGNFFLESIEFNSKIDVEPKFPGVPPDPGPKLPVPPIVPPIRLPKGPSRRLPRVPPRAGPPRVFPGGSLKGPSIGVPKGLGGMRPQLGGGSMRGGMRGGMRIMLI